MGGRIGKASEFVGSILNIKPVMTLDDGIVVPLKKAKGNKRVKREIVELTKEASAQAGGKKLNIGLVHADAADAVDELEDALRQEGIDFNLVLKSELGSVIGTYTGPGAFAILYYPSRDNGTIDTQSSAPASKSCSTGDKQTYEPC